MGQPVSLSTAFSLLGPQSHVIIKHYCGIKHLCRSTLPK